MGQGPVGDIAVNNGFKNFKTIEDIRQAFPTLDAVDHTRRKGMGLFQNNVTQISLKFDNPPTPRTLSNTIYNFTYK